MLKEQIKNVIYSYGVFHNSKKLEECAEEVYSLLAPCELLTRDEIVEAHTPSEAAKQDALGLIDKSLTYLKSLTPYSNNADFIRGFDNALNEALSELQMLQIRIGGG